MLKFLREDFFAKPKKRTENIKLLQNQTPSVGFAKISYSNNIFNSYVNSIEGDSFIGYDSADNEVWSISLTEGTCFHNRNEGDGLYNDCSSASVDAGISDSDGTAIAVDGNSSNSNSAELYLYATPEIDGQHCVDSEHSVEDDSDYTSDYTQSYDCVNVDIPANSEISSVEFQELNSPLDTNPGNGNPNTNIGERIFPDKTNPGDISDRSTVVVNATVFPAKENVEIYFKTFDMDDPSADTAPIDDESIAQDNRGNVSGKKEGTFSNGANTISIRTDANGNASVILTVTKQPGDNFAVAASKDNNYLGNIAVSGTDLKNGSQTIATSGNTTPSNPALRTEMLTVWRRLHIEVDDMGVVTGNKETGSITGALSINANTIRLNIDKVFEDARFEPGTIVIDGIGTFPVITHANIGANDILGITSTLPASNFIGKIFTIYDDDDFNNNRQNGGNLGDNGEDIVPFNDTLSRIQTSNNPTQNSFAAAYILPFQDGGGNMSFNNHDVYFSRNNPDILDVNAQIGQGRDSNVNENDDFWICYIQIAYQGEKSNDADPDFSTSDADPDTLGITTVGEGQVDSVNNSSQVPKGGNGSLIFMETISDSLIRRNLSENGIVAVHEIGHQFGIRGDLANQAVMSGSFSGINSFIPTHLNMMRWRVKSPGQ